MTKRVVLAYSGGLDTSVAVRWIQEEWDAEVVALAVDVGQQADDPWDEITARARAAGAIEARVVDARAEFADDYLVNAIHANALYEGKYPLVSALSRPVIAKHLVLAAREFGADSVAHGCTGKGNDQVRFEVSVRALAPDLDVLAPVRMWGFTRDDSIDYAAKHDIPISVTKKSPYSIDENLWGRAIECGMMEDPWIAPPDDAYALTRNVADAPTEVRDVVVRFERGVPVALDGVVKPLHELVIELGAAVGAYGWGRLDMVENRRVGIKSRETYECPGSLALLLAHADLESITLERDLMREKARLEPRYAELIYDGLWFSPLKEALDAFMGHAQEFVTGEVRLRLEPGRCFVTGRRADRGLYSYDLATYDAADSFRHEDSAGFVRLWGLSVETWARQQGGGGVTLWHGRFAEGPADALLAFTESLSFDRRLAPDDLAGSRAHVAGLVRAGVLTDGEAGEVVAALDQVEAELVDGAFEFAPSDEDIHTAIERRVTEIAGVAGAKLHTGRSRNDQVATALRLFLRREGTDVAAHVHQLQEVLVTCADQADDVYLPGYTHLQRAQPVLLAHHFLAHFWAFARDVERWRDAINRADVSPLGAGALAGSSLPLDPDATAADLGFARRFDNSLDAVSDRDFVAEALFVAALTQVHLSRLGEEIVLWSSEEFGFLRLADAYSTGSSMLPQKKNPDIAELARGKAGRLIGDLTGFLATLKGLPLAYNRDLQEDKEPLFDALDQCRLALGAIAGLLATAELVAARMQGAADGQHTAAVDLAEWMVQRGVPFRDAHARVGALVRHSAERGVPLDELVLTEPDLGPEALALLEPGAAVLRRTTPGGAGPASVEEQMLKARARLEEQARWLQLPRLSRGRTLPRSFYARDSIALAPELLNKLLVHRAPDGTRLAARIVEVEAYRGSDDAGSHAFRGMTPRIEVMFGPPGHLYVYFTYGMHWCANVVATRDGDAAAVLVRAAAPVDGIELMRSRRVKARSDRDLLAGPARLTQAFGITGADNGNDLVRGPIRILDDGVPPPVAPGVSNRVGLSPGRGDEHPWRFVVPGDPNSSRGPRGAPG